jgi:hydroxymethylpyrimidine pyrophosphatase-like HAD family hydrolase/DNA-binding MurR/RpiR family transcriptional regulator
MTIFGEKLDGVAATLALAIGGPLSEVASALVDGGTRLAVAVGSGGSAVCATFLADCRRTLGYPFTQVLTPAAFVLSGEEVRSAQVWLFSGSGENNDILAALEACATLPVADIHVITSRANSTLADRAANLASIHICPVADEKDGFLATHSLAAATSLVLLAADAACPHPLGASLAERYREVAEHRLSTAPRKFVREALSAFRDGQTLFLLHDPRLATAAIEIETSCWEAALSTVQRVDFRNFAHGRHVWAEQRAGNAYFLALTTPESRPLWTEIDALLPSTAARSVFETPIAGRLGGALSVIDALVIVEGLGTAVGRDPGKPGVGDFGRDIYEGSSLLTVARSLTAAVRQKRTAIERFDPLDAGEYELLSAWAKTRQTWENTLISGLVLDFDGTIVTVEDRFDPVPISLARILENLLDAGLRLGIATGRGGSAGEALRAALPPHLHRDVLVGYYNGAWVQPLDTDLRANRPPRPEIITQAFAWLTEEGGFDAARIKDGSVQLTLKLEDVPNLDQLARALDQAGINGLRLARSSHTVDICLRSTCKTSVVDALAERWGLNVSSILRIGDSGGPLGNDYMLLGSAMGISVGEVCARSTAGWPLFGPPVSGPAALAKILENLSPQADGGFQLDVSALS